MMCAIEMALSLLRAPSASTPLQWHRHGGGVPEADDVGDPLHGPVRLPLLL